MVRAGFKRAVIASRDFVERMRPSRVRARSGEASETASPSTPRATLQQVWQQTPRDAEMPPLSRFAYLVRQALFGMARAPLTTLLTCLTITVALFILGAVLMVFANVEQLLAGAQRDLTVSAFFREGTSASEIGDLRREIASRPEIVDVRVRSKEEALEEFRQFLGAQRDALDGLEGENPLPASIEVQLEPSATEGDVYQALVATLRAAPIVEHVQYSEGSLSRLRALVGFIEQLALAASALVLLVAAFIISATIALALYAHREEIEIMRLVGATQWYIRTPYMIEGCLQGIVGACLSILVLSAGHSAAVELIANSEVASALFPELAFLSPGALLLIPFAGVLVGLAGSFVAVRRFAVF